jgi:hypothetical protein
MVFYHLCVPPAGLDVMTLAHDVPFVSQQAYRDPEWRRFGCGTASLKMVFDFWHGQDPVNRTDDAESIYATGLAAGAFDPAVGWRHAGLVGLATSLGYDAYSRDFGPRSAQPKSGPDAVAELASELRRGPVIASVYRDFDPSRGGGHLVVITGTRDMTIHLNDPLPADERDGRCTIGVPVFLPAFKHRYIVVRPGA